MLRFHGKWMAVLMALAAIVFFPARGQTQAVTVQVGGAGSGGGMAPRFLGLSYEMSYVLPNNGHYYFDAQDQALIRVFQTLGIKSLRVGANAVDDPRVAVPQEKDIDALFGFARAAGVKVIYSFRLKNGNPAEAARLAGYIAAHDGDMLDSFSIGNEPASYDKQYDVYFANWKAIYDAILQTVPNAVFDAPSVVGDRPPDFDYVMNLIRDVWPDGHLAMMSNHYYFLGSGRDGEKNPAATRARFVSNAVHRTYEDSYQRLGAILAKKGIPYRLDELNSCYNGGAKDASDTYASALWALDCTHWWAMHHILGMNYHTGDQVGRDGGFSTCNYAGFVRQAGGEGFEIRPQGYAYLAFSQSAHGTPLEATIETAPEFDFNAYAYRDGDGSLAVTLINKSYGAQGRAATVALELPSGMGSGTWREMDLTQQDGDIAAKTGVKLGGSGIDSQGHWSGQWRKIQIGNSEERGVTVPPASAVLLHFSPGS